MKLYTLLAAGAVSLSACVTAPVYDPIIPYSQLSADPVTFLVAEDMMPEKAVGLDVPIDYSAAGTAIANPYLVPGGNLGTNAAGGAIAMLLIGAVDAGFDANRNKRINNFLDENAFDASAVFEEALTQAISERGHDTAFAKQDEETPEALPVLSITIDHYGYRLVMGGWMPSAAASIEITSADGSETLMKDTVALGAPPLPVLPANQDINPLGSGTVILPYNPAFVFKKVDGIVEDRPDLALEGLDFAMRQLAFGIADLIGGQDYAAAISLAQVETK